MEIKILFRHFQKLIILFVFVIVTAILAMLLFSQSYVDGIGLKYAEKYYSYTGTLKYSYSDLPEVQLISEEAIELLNSSGYLSGTEQVFTRTGSIAGVEMVPDMHINYDLSNYCIFVGIVKEIRAVTDYPIYTEEQVMIEVENIYAGTPDLEKYNGSLYLSILYATNTKEQQAQVGERFFVIARYAHNGVRLLDNSILTMADSPNKIWPGKDSYDEKLFGNAFIRIDSDLKNGELEKRGKELVAENGLTEYVLYIWTRTHCE